MDPALAKVKDIFLKRLKSLSPFLEKGSEPPTETRTIASVIERSSRGRPERFDLEYLDLALEAYVEQLACYPSKQSEVGTELDRDKFFPALLGRYESTNERPDVHKFLRAIVDATRNGLTLRNLIWLLASPDYDKLVEVLRKFPEWKEFQPVDPVDPEEPNPEYRPNPNGIW